MASKNIKEEKKVEKYLTEIKELPPEGKEISEEKMEKSPPKAQDKEAKVTLDNEEAENGILSEGENEQGFLKRLPISTKDLILGLINLITLVLLIIVLLRFPARSGELKELRIEDLRNRSNVSFEFTEIEASKTVAQQMDSLFLNESGVVDFVSAVEGIRSEGGSFRTITFANQQAVKDSTGNFGLPVVIELEGSWQTINADLQRIDALPYLFRPVRVEIEKSDTQEDMIVFNYGIFLYVNDEFGQN